MHRAAVGKMFGQVGPQHVNDKSRRALRGEHGNLGTLTHRQQGLRRDLPIGQHQRWRLQRDNAGNPAGAILLRRIGEVGNFALPQNLDAVRMNVVEVANQIGPGTCRTHRNLIKAAF